MQFTETEDEENEELDSETLIEKDTILMTKIPTITYGSIRAGNFKTKNERWFWALHRKGERLLSRDITLKRLYNQSINKQNVKISC